MTLVVTNKNDYYSDLDNSVIGIDEVGRGALSGPVVSCALILNKNIRQEKLFGEIGKTCDLFLETSCEYF